MNAKNKSDTQKLEMNSDIRQEFGVFCTRIKHLRQILADTQKCFNDINNAGRHNGSQLATAELSECEEKELESLVKRPPGIVILGQTNQVKALVVNEILGKYILPTTDPEPEGTDGDVTHMNGGSCSDRSGQTGATKWRAVRMKYGKKPRIAFCLANSFELIGEAEPSQKIWTTIPLDALQVTEQIHTAPSGGVHPGKVLGNQVSEHQDVERLSDDIIDNVSDEEEESPVKAEDTNHIRLEPELIKRQMNNPDETSATTNKPHIDPDQIMLSSHEDDSCMTVTEQSTIEQNGSEQDMEDSRSSCECPIYDEDDIDDDDNNQDIDHDDHNTSDSDNVPESPTKLKQCQNSQTRPSNYSAGDLQRSSVIVEVSLNHSLFSGGAQIIVAQSLEDSEDMSLVTIVETCMTDMVPIFVYALTDEVFSQEELVKLKKLRELLPDIAIFFVKVPPLHVDTADPFSPMKRIRSTLERHSSPVHIDRKSLTDGTSILRKRAVSTAQSSMRLFQQLLEIGYLNILPGAGHSEPQPRPESDSDSNNYYAVESELAENFDNFINHFVDFVHKGLHCHLVKTVGLMNVIHVRCLQTFIMSAFDMARDMMITPRRIVFAKEKENELYSSLMEMALRKQDEIRRIIAETITGMKVPLIEKAADYEFVAVDLLPSGEVTSSRDLKKCTCQIQDLVLGNLNSAVAHKLLGSVDILKDSYTGVLTRCLESLEQSDVENNKEMIRTSIALKEILTSAYQVEITIRAGTSVVKVLLEKMKQLMHSMPWKQAPIIDDQWKKQVATDMLSSLSEARLAKSICSQIKERLKYSHDAFSSALKQLESRHSGRLERTEEQRLRVRKVHAPRVARLALESTSFKDLVAYGMPIQGREIGRGQYGVVHACDKWAGYNPCAIKSVVPPDDKHWNDLAMEFYYTKNVPEHDRVVILRGSVVDYGYGGGSPAVLLIMDRLVQDLYTGIKGGLSWHDRLQVAIDVVEGIRYLHSQGLVHRDIKLKNVLLDEHKRGKLTDLGFCKPEAMMSGSIVGTPIHMAPELFSGRYDNSVDVYAFGILFWYVCAGHVRLPYNFEQCTNKEMLWTSVRRGVRPEKLAQFESSCWDLMQSCWEGEPSRRPLLGFVEPKLHVILDKARTSKTSTRSRNKASRKETSSHGTRPL